MSKRFTGKTLTTKHDHGTWCPVCFAVITASTCMTSEARPQPGDFTVCISCASVLRFTKTMDLELSSLESIETHSRMDFARMVQIVKLKGKRDEPLRIT